jgi:uncharacterized repeat protein (TIGR01451 family)
MEPTMKNIRRFAHGFGRFAQAGLAASLVLLGLVAFTTVASAHNDTIVGVSSCSSPLGSGYTISWTVANDWDISEAGTVTSVTDGLATLHATIFSIAAQDAAYATSKTSRGATLPYLTAALTQKLPAGAPGVITLTTSSTWADGVQALDSGTAELSSLHCGAASLPASVVSTPASQPIAQTIAAHIYLCNNTIPSASEVPGGSLASTGPQTLGSSPNPLPSTEVAPGGYVVTATPPPGYVLVVCGGTSSPVSGGTGATEAVTVPAGGSAVGIFFVTNFAPAVRLVKSATESSFDAAGETINYDYLITNTGNVTLAAVRVIDARVGLTGLNCPDSTLAAGASETCSATYQVTPADVSAGSIVNTATAQGIPPSVTTPITSLPSSATVPLAAVGILKQVCGTEVATACGPGGHGPWLSSADVPQGDTAYWKVTVTNTGDTPITNVTVSDPLAPGCDTSGATLAVGATLSTYCSSPDISATVVNVATTSFGGELPPFASSSAQVEDTAVPKTLASVLPVAPISTSGALDVLVPASEAPVVTG